MQSKNLIIDSLTRKISFNEGIKYSLKGSKSTKLITTTLPFVIIFGILALINENILIVLFGIACALVFAPVILYFSGRAQLRYDHFSRDNNLTYTSSLFLSPNGLPFAPSKIFPINCLLFTVGSVRRFGPVFGKENWYIGGYQYTTGSGKNRQTHHFTIGGIKLNKTLPHLVLDSKKNNFLMSNLPVYFDNKQKISLEGNFDDYYQAYMPLDYHIDILSYITPEVMEFIISMAEKYDIEIVDDMLYIIKNGGYSVANDSNDIKNSLEILARELIQNTRSYKDARISQTADGANHEVAPEGRRLRRNNSSLIVLALAVGIAAATIPKNSFFPTIFLVIVFLLPILSRYIKKR